VKRIHAAKGIEIPTNVKLGVLTYRVGENNE